MLPNLDAGGLPVQARFFIPISAGAPLDNFYTLFLIVTVLALAFLIGFISAL